MAAQSGTLMPTDVVCRPTTSRAMISPYFEGRLTTSVGISVPDCAAIMAKHDCMQAMNLDGGTSAMIWYKGKYIMRSSNPALTAGRTLPNAFVYAGK